jgi:hypothetical protein
MWLPPDAAITVAFGVIKMEAINHGFLRFRVLSWCS